MMNLFLQGHPDLTRSMIVTRIDGLIRRSHIKNLQRGTRNGHSYPRPHPFFAATLPPAQKGTRNFF
jgi:hypothetical protein